MLAPQPRTGTSRCHTVRRIASEEMWSALRQIVGVYAAEEFYFLLYYL